MKKVALFTAIIITSYCYAPPVDFSSWDIPRQCHGDADGLKQLGVFWVFNADAAIFQAVYSYPGGDWPAVWPGSINYDPRADFDRNFKVNDLDGDIISLWNGQTTVPGDCGKKLSFKTTDPACLLADTFTTINWIWKIYTQYIPMPGDEDYPGILSLYYSTNGGANWTHIANVSSGSSYNWLVPDINSPACLLKIVDNDHTGLLDTKAVSIRQCLENINGDFNGDCYVNEKDLLVIAEYWVGEECTESNNWCQGADFEPNTIVDFRDFSTFAQNWRLCKNPCDAGCSQ
jgi:hypothetical protein